jgi:hypothetical protein
MAGQLSYCFRRMSWAATPEAEDYWWREVQKLGRLQSTTEHKGMNK